MPLWELKDSVHIGHAIKPHGYLGNVKVAFLFPGFEDYLDPGDFLFLLIHEKPVPYQIEEIHWQNEESALIKFTDVENEEQAALIRGDFVLPLASIPTEIREEIEGPNYYGYEVVDEEGNLLGKVEEVREELKQPLLVLLNEADKEILLPIHEDIILEIDVERERIIVSLPEGLLDLN